MPGFVVPVVVHSSGSSLNNPCPSGTGIGYATLNGSNTIFVICGPGFNSNSLPNSSSPLEIGLGIGLGCGIPMIAVIIWMYYRYYYLSNPYTVRQRQEQQILAHPQPQLTPQQKVEKLIKGDLLDNFKKGLLTPRLMEALKDIRKKEGRDLIEFSQYARELSHNHIADYVDNLTIVIMNNTV